MFMSKSLSAAIVGFPKELAKFTLEARDELKKVTWPSRQTTVNYTVVVALASLAIGLVTGAVDYGLSQLLKLFI